MSGKSTSTLTAESLTDYSSMVVPVTITAGAEKLTAPAAAPTGTDSSTVATATGSESSSPDASSTADGTSSTSTGGMPRITQNAVLVGAAALVGGALML